MWRTMEQCVRSVWLNERVKVFLSVNVSCRTTLLEFKFVFKMSKSPAWDWSKSCFISATVHHMQMHACSSAQRETVFPQRVLSTNDSNVVFPLLATECRSLKQQRKISAPLSYCTCSSSKWHVYDLCQCDLSQNHRTYTFNRKKLKVVLDTLKFGKFILLL